MGRGIDITLGLKDNLSGALKSTTRSVAGELDSLQKKMDGMKGPKLGASGGGGSSGGGAGGAGGGLSMGGLITGNLISDALSNIASGILNAGGMLVGAIGDQFKASEEANRSALGATSANAALLGIAFKDSAKMTTSISATLAKSAEKLPGATKDYLEAFNGVSDTLVLSGGMTKKGLTESGKQMVELTALLGKASGSGSATTSTVLGKMLGDTGSEALFRIDAFEKVPAFKALLEKDLEKAGKTLKDFFKMDAKAKQEQLVGVKKQLFSKDYIDQMNLSMGAQLDTLQGKLSDPTSGLFGFMRTVKFEGGNTNVLTELGKTFAVLSAAAGEVLGAMGGVSFDPMVALVAGLRGLANFVKNPGEALPGVVSGLMSGLGSFVQSLVLLPVQLVSGLGSMLMGLAADGGQVQTIAATVSAGVVGWVTNAINGLSAQRGDALEGIFGVLLGGFALIGNVALGIIYGVAGQLPSLLGAIGSSMMASLQLFGSILGMVWNESTAYLGEMGGQIMGAIGGFFGSFISSIVGLHTAVVEGVGSAVTSIATGFTSLISGLPGQLAQIGSAISGIGSAIAGYITSKLSSLVGGGGGNVGSKYSGQNLHLTNQNSFTGGKGNMNRVLTASNGLFDAANLESARMPSGSSLVMANSSELIIPRNQIDRVLNGSGTTVNIVVNSKADRVIQDTVAALTEALNRPAMSMV
jgi:hypothetical protein